MNMDDGEYTGGASADARRYWSFSGSSQVASRSSPSPTGSCISDPPSAIFFAALPLLAAVAAAARLHHGEKA